MVREFSEEKRQEIFRLLDEIDMRNWKSFMEWCGSRKEEFGDWPDKLSVSAYTRYVDQYHEKVLEINEMTRQQVNTVFENVAEIDARYAARLREHREKVKEQIAIVKTMTEFMGSMANGNPNLALLSETTVNENCVRTEGDEKEENTVSVIKWEEFFDPVEEGGPLFLAQCLREHGVTDQDEINTIVEWVNANNFELLNDLYLAGIYGRNSSQNKDLIYNKIMGNYYAFADLGNDKKIIEFDCYWVRENFSLLDCGTDEYIKYIAGLYQSGYVREEDYRSFCYWNGVINHVSSAEADKIRNIMQERFEHVITTVYIYNCLQILTDGTDITFTSEDCCEANEIFWYFGITDCNSIANFLVCCAVESGGFRNIREIYGGDVDYSEDESGIGYLQITLEENQMACLEYINDLNDKGDLIENRQEEYTGKLEDYPWTVSAWYWAVCTKTDDGNLNNYVANRCNENDEKLTLGIVLTAECFVHGDVIEGTGIDPVLKYIARDDSLRSNNGRKDGGWYIDGQDKNCRLYIPLETLEEIKNRILNDGKEVPSEWGESDSIDFQAPYNWEDFEGYYNDLQKEGLLDFDLNTEMP